MSLLPANHVTLTAATNIAAVTDGARDVGAMISYMFRACHNLVG